MFTSRSEYRLLLGIDTASRRLTKHGCRVGLLSDARADSLACRWQRIDGAVSALERERCAPDGDARRRLGRRGVELSGNATSADVLRRPEVAAGELDGLSPVLDVLPTDERRIAVETIKYTGYVERQRREAARVARAGVRRIPEGFAYRGLSGLSNELVEKLEAVRPENLARASRIDGMTPAALSLLAAHLERPRPSRAP